MTIRRSPLSALFALPLILTACGGADAESTADETVPVITLPFSDRSQYTYMGGDSTLTLSCTDGGHYELAEPESGYRVTNTDSEYATDEIVYEVTIDVPDADTSVLQVVPDEGGECTVDT
ncbi:hypothetical protein [Corynebacterium glyciniphilum]|uniref:hypothetical protein n=1 Tax=Corynebacterium glyciniphilum TaxID=1404244 RepID=UPI0026561C29|nr:hypothetical protein [Corynebacterium glyciniphilum]MDN6707326.1 hypothetical protein [Corynebacterium glyciniphilum]